MKKLSIEEKARMYDEAVKIISKCATDKYGCIIGIKPSDLFPELSESYDESIRKWIIDELSDSLHNIEALYSGDYDNRDINDEIREDYLRMALAWLEKQKPSAAALEYLKENHSSSEVSDFQAAMNIAVAKAYDQGRVDAIAEMQKQDSCSNCDHPVFSLEEYSALIADELLQGTALTSNGEFDIASVRKLIIDACKIGAKWQEQKLEKEKQDEQESVAKVTPKYKVGDWVVNNNGEPQFFRVTARSWPDSKIKRAEDNLESFINTATLDKQYHLWTIDEAKDGDVLVNKHGCPFIFKDRETCWCYYSVSCEDFHPNSNKWFFSSEDCLYPATKEQREFLFYKMHEAGYEWDAEKKELKKISQEYPTTSDECIKSAWDEEDEKRLSWVIKYFNPSGELYSNLIYWLKSIKDRIQSQSQWNPSDEDKLRIKQAIKYLSKKLTFESEKDDYNFREGQIKWLKSLKDRVQPRQEWKQENIDDLTDFENAMMHIGGSFFGENAGLDPNDTNAIKEQANLLLELVPKQEWSEEDVAMLDSAIAFVERSAFTTIGKGKNNVIAWLKSIKDRVLPKIEWSEEDEKFFKTALLHIRYSVNNDHCETTDWLKSLKQRMGG